MQSPWLYDLGRSYCQWIYLDHAIPVRPRLHDEQMLPCFLLLVLWVSFKLIEACRPRAIIHTDALVNLETHGMHEL